MRRRLNDNFLLNLAGNRAHIQNYSCKIHQFDRRMWLRSPPSNRGMQALQNSLCFICWINAGRKPLMRTFRRQKFAVFSFVNLSPVTTTATTKKKKQNPQVARVFECVWGETRGCACVLMLNDSPGFVPPRSGSRFASGRNNRALSLRTHAPSLALSKQAPTTGLQAARVQK